MLTEGVIGQRRALANKMREILQLEGRLSPQELALANDAFWPEGEPLMRDKLLDDAFHCLQHFFADRDIRIKDADYAAQQIAAMTAYIEKLEGSF